MTDVENLIETTVARIGPLAGRVPHARADLQALAGRIPDALVRLFDRMGVGVWGEGRWQTVEPRRFDGVLRQVFAGDPDFDPADLTLVALRAFGHAWLWHRRLGYLHFSVYPNRVSAPDSHFGKPLTQPDQTALIAFAVMPTTSARYDEFDSGGRPLFDRLVRLHGPLAPGQIFAPRLHPALGGVLSLETLRPVPAVEALGLIAQAEPVTLIDGRRPRPVVLRPIGWQG